MAVDNSNNNKNGKDDDDSNLGMGGRSISSALTASVYHPHPWPVYYYTFPPKLAQLCNNFIFAPSRVLFVFITVFLYIAA